MRAPARRLIVVGSALVVLATACNGDDDGGSDEVSESTQGATETTARPPSRDGAGSEPSRTGGRRSAAITRLVEQAAADDGGEAPAYRGYDAITDATQQLRIEVPATWTDRETAEALIESAEVPFIGASPDRRAFRDTFDVPGVQVSALPSSTTVDGALAEFSFSGPCADAGVGEYSDGELTGKLQVWQDCGGTTSAIVIVAANPPDGSVTTLLLAQVVTDADYQALARAMTTLELLN